MKAVFKESLHRTPGITPKLVVRNLPAFHCPHRDLHHSKPSPFGLQDALGVEVEPVVAGFIIETVQSSTTEGTVSNRVGTHRKTIQKILDLR